MLNALTEQTEEGHSTQRFHFFPLVFSTLTACLSFHCHVAGHTILQLHSYQSTRQIIIKNVYNNSLAEKRSLPGCPQLVGKVVMVRLRMITLVSEMRRPKESTSQTTNQGDHSLLQNPPSIS